MEKTEEIRENNNNNKINIKTRKNGRTRKSKAVSMDGGQMLKCLGIGHKAVWVFPHTCFGPHSWTCSAYGDHFI
jgi:hypothetical protein